MDLPIKISLFAFAVMLYGGGIFLHIKKGGASWRWSLTAVVLAGLLLRVICAADPLLHEWDERYHALVAKNMAEGSFLTPTLYADAPLDFDYRNWFAAHIWLHKQPLPTWCMALSVKAFGVSEWAVRLPSVLLSTTAIGLTSLLGRRLFSARVGFWAAFFCSVNGLVIAISTGRAPTDHVDGFFLFFTLLAVVFSANGWEAGVFLRKKVVPPYVAPLAAGAAVGAAILCKWLPALVVVPIFVLLQTGQRDVWKRAACMVAAAVLVAAPWQVYAALNFPEPFWIEQQHNWLHITTVLDGHDEPLWFYLAQASRVWNELVWLPLLWLGWHLSHNRSAPRYLALAVWVVIPYLFFTLVKTKMPGYVLFCGPAVFLCEALFLEWTWAEKKRAVAMALHIAFVVLALRYGMERVRPSRSDGPERDLRQRIVALQEYTDGGQKTVLLNEQRCIEVMFYTDLLAYFRMPSAEEIQQLNATGWRILVADSPDVPELLRADERVEVVRW